MDEVEHRHLCLAYSWLETEVRLKPRLGNAIPMTPAFKMKLYGLSSQTEATIDKHEFYDYLSSIGANVPRIMGACLDYGWIKPIAENSAKTKLCVDTKRLSEGANEFALGKDDEGLNNLNGPFPPNGFRWNDKESRGLPPLPWRLINFLWQQPNQCALLEDLAEPVWQDRAELIESSNFGSARRDANNWLEKNGMPFKVSKRDDTASLSKQ